MTFVPSSVSTFNPATPRINPAVPTTRVRSYGTSNRLQLLMPGETAAAGTATGKTGTPSSRTAGAAFTVTVNATDSGWNVLTGITDIVAISSTDGSATMPANAAIVAGTKTFSVTFGIAGSFTVTAIDLTDATKSSSPSPPTTVV